MVILLQNWSSKGTNKPKCAISHMRHGGLLSACACGLIALGKNNSIFIDTFIVFAIVLLFTFAELLIVAGVEGLVLHYIPYGQRPVYFAVFNLGFAVATIVGAILITLTLNGQTLSWLIWASFFILISILVMTFSKQH